MTISLKSTIVFSASLAALLNVWQFAHSYTARADALAPTWNTVGLASPAQATGVAKATATPLATKTPAPLSDTPPANTPAPARTVATATVITTPQDSNVAAELATAGLNPSFASLYLTVQSETNTPWELLAAVHKTETNQAGNTDRMSSAGATGPMQFLPATFNHYAVPGHDDITSVQDSMLAAGRYLAAGGAADGDYSDALYHYNHSYTYVDHVLGIANQLGL
jgi:membrane-bound lytic murein transglycosylase B